MIQDYLVGIPDTLIVLGVILFWVALLWHVLNIITPFNDHHEIGAGNVAFAAQRTALMAAQVVGMLATIPGYDDTERLSSFLWMMAEGLWVFIAIIMSRFFMDWLLLPGINNTELIRQNNAAIAAVEVGSYLGIGFILAGSLTGGADTFGLSLASTVVFYLLGLAFVFGVFWLHELVTPYHLRGRLKEGSLTAGIEVGSLILAMALVVRVGVAGDFTGWVVGLQAFLLTSVISVAILYPSRWILNRIGPGQRDRDVQDGEHVAAAVVSGSMLILMGLAVSATVSMVL